MKSFRYIGGKYYIKDWIIEHLDFSKSAYLELFCGSAVILLYKPRHKVEIINDFNQDIANLFYCLKEKYDEFMKESQYIVDSRAWFYRFKEELKSNISSLGDVKRAVKYYYILRIAFGGIMVNPSWGMQFKKKRNIIDSNFLSFVHQRLEGVQIENRDYKEVLDIVMNTEDICIYADPPYYGKEYYYTGFTKQDHFILAEMLNKCKGYVVVSYYEFEHMKDLYPPDKWNYYKRDTIIFSEKSKNGRAKKKATEFLLVKKSSDLIRYRKTK